MASIKKKSNGAYEITVSLGRNPDGTKAIKTTTYHPKAKKETAIDKEVSRFAFEFEKKVKDGLYLSGEHLTFAAITERWYSESAPKKLADSGEYDYETIKRYAYPAFGSFKISKINTLQVQALISDLERRELAPASIRRILASINSVFRYAYRMRIISENPCANSRIELPKMKKDNEEIHYFTPDQVKRFLVFMQKPYAKTVKAHDQIDDTGKPYHVPEYTQMITMPLQHQVFFFLAIYGGFRRGEIAALTWEDIDFKKHRITINKAIARRKDGQVVKCPKSDRGYRTVTLPAVCFDFLQRWKKEQLAYRLKLGSAWEGNVNMDKTTIFMKDFGGMMDISTVRKRFLSIINRYNEQCKEADKLPEIRLHDLRHTCASLLISKGFDIVTVAGFLGHDPEVCMRNYAHMFKSKFEEIAEALGEAYAIG